MTSRKKASPKTDSPKSAGPKKGKGRSKGKSTSSGKKTKRAKAPDAAAGTPDQVEPGELEEAGDSLLPVPAPVAEEPVAEIIEAEPLEEEPLDGAVVAAEPDQALAVPIPPKASSTQGLVRYDPLTAYIQEIRRYPLLSREEEIELAKRYKEEGDLEAARRLIISNLRLVVKIAHEYRKAHQNLLDLIQEGNVGLVQAVQKFDPYRGIKLSTYSAWWIRAYILRFILNNWRLVKIGTTQAQRKLFFNLKKEKQRLERMGIKPDPKAVAKSLGVSEHEVVDMERRLAAPELSLSAPVSATSDGSSPRTVLDVIPDEDLPPDEAVAAEEFRRLLNEKLEEFSKTLKGRDAVIFRERLMTDTPLTLKEIGDRYGITKERARQLEKRLMGKLREYLRKEMGDAVEVALGLEH